MSQMLRNMTATPQGILILLIIITILGGVFLWLILGTLFVGIIVLIFWTVFLPGILGFAGVVVILYFGMVQKNPKAVVVGFLMIFIAVALSILLR